MTSLSTLLSRYRIPYMLLLVCASFVVALGLGCLFQFCGGNPVVTFYTAGDKLAETWAQKLDKTYPNKYVAIGTSCAKSSLNPMLIIEEFNQPVLNAATGAYILDAATLERALDFIRPGDTLILTGVSSSLFPTVGAQFLLSTRGPFQRTQFVDFPALDRIRALSPGLSQLALTGFAKIAGREPFRYSEADLNEAGWQNIEIKETLWAVSGLAVIKDEALETIKEMKALMEKMGCKVIFSNDVVLIQPWDLYRSRSATAASYAKIADIMPVLKDETLGLCPNHAYFSDKPLHPNRAGADTRSRILGHGLKHNLYWTKQELLDLSAYYMKKHEEYMLLPEEQKEEVCKQLMAEPYEFTPPAPPQL